MFAWLIWGVAFAEGVMEHFTITHLSFPLAHYFFPITEHDCCHPIQVFLSHGYEACLGFYSKERNQDMNQVNFQKLVLHGFTLYFQTIQIKIIWCHTWKKFPHLCDKLGFYHKWRESHSLISVCFPEHSSLILTVLAMISKTDWLKSRFSWLISNRDCRGTRIF